MLSGECSTAKKHKCFTGKLIRKAQRIRRSAHGEQNKICKDV